MAIDGLYVPQNALWVADLRSELLSFPAGKYDDQVDALGLIGQLLDTISVGNKPVQAHKRKLDSGYRTFDFGGGRDNEWLVY
jgi:phage terminase large subunit-like protein